MPEKVNAVLVKELLDHPERAARLEAEQLEQALHALIGLSGNSSDPVILEKIKPLYRHAMTRLHPATRLHGCQVMVDHVIDGDLAAQSLLPYLVCDEDRTLASTAALDYALLAPTSEDEPTSAAAFLVDACSHGAFANGPAVIGGLLLSGDRRILELLVPVCRAMSCEEIEELIQCRGSLLMAAVVEFYLNWLEHIDSHSEQDVFGTVAAGLANLALGDSTGIVYEIERVIPSTRDRAVKVFDQWSISDYVALIAPRMQELAAKEQGEPVMPEVLSIWREQT